MLDNWTTENHWIAHFDILGVKEILKSNKLLAIDILKSQIDDMIAFLKKNNRPADQMFEYHFYADTFIIKSKIPDIKSYPEFLSVCKRFIRRCISMSVPIRGAISFGEVTMGYNDRVFIGTAFYESHIYSEAQDWLGLVMCPSAISELSINNLKPLHHGFVQCDIPFKENSVLSSANALAYGFSDGSANFKSPLIHFLEDMLKSAPIDVKDKYVRTIAHILKYDRVF